MGLTNRKKKRKYIVLAVIVVLVAFLVSIPFLIAWHDQQKKEQIISDFANNKIGNILVNNETISNDSISMEYNNLPDNVKATVTKENIAKSIIAQKLILDQAKKSNVTVNDSEIDSYIGTVLNISNISKQNFLDALNKSNISLSEYKNGVSEQITVEKVIKTVVENKKVNVSDNEVNSYLNKNKQQFSDFFEPGNENELTLLKQKIKSNLMVQKQTTLVNDYVANLMNSANIEVQ